MEMGETPLEVLVREVQEETGYLVRPGQLVGVYSKPEQDDLVISITADMISRNPWQPNGEIAECRFFGVNELPQPMNPNTLVRIQDAFDHRTGLLRVL